MAVIGHYLSSRLARKTPQPSGPVKYALCLPLTLRPFLASRLRHATQSSARSLQGRRGPPDEGRSGISECRFGARSCSSDEESQHQRPNHLELGRRVHRTFCPMSSISVGYLLVWGWNPGITSKTTGGSVPGISGHGPYLRRLILSRVYWQPCCGPIIYMRAGRAEAPGSRSQHLLIPNQKKSIQ